MARVASSTAAKAPDEVPRRILVCRGGALGDFVVTLPVLAALRKRWPGARLDLLAYPRHAALAQACGLADGVRSLDDAGLAAWFDDGAPGLPDAEAGYVAAYDLIVCFLHDPDGGVRDRLEGAGPGRVVCHTPIVQGIHAVDHLGGALARLGITTDSAPYLPLPVDVLSRGRVRLRALGEQVVLLHPGSGSPGKNWPLSHYLELARDLAAGGRGLTPVFLAGEAERPMLAELVQAGPVLSGLPILEAAGVLASSWGYIGNDSGISHVAAAVGAHVVALFGPTDPVVWAPRGAHVTVLRAAPPYAGGMSRLSVASVAEALRRITSRRMRTFAPH
jgi:heptosyltransferase-3